jgi:hypothetical protein
MVGDNVRSLCLLRFQMGIFNLYRSLARSCVCFVIHPVILSSLSLLTSSPTSFKCLFSVPLWLRQFWSLPLRLVEAGEDFLMGTTEFVDGPVNGAQGIAVGRSRLPGLGGEFREDLA